MSIYYGETPISERWTHGSHLQARGKPNGTRAHTHMHTRTHMHTCTHTHTHVHTHTDAQVCAKKELELGGWQKLGALGSWD